MAKRINISPTDEFRQRLQAYADEHGISLSEAVVTLAAIGLGEDVQPMKPHGDPTRIMRIASDLKTWQCLWCGNVFFAKDPWECPECGEDEVNQVVNK